ncbi:MAG: RNA polymerase sigma-70 factor [Actinomycetota bacterium]|nr:RNA polymerase sigma-70 factor [Actinomycetota bacterium]
MAEPEAFIAVRPMLFGVAYRMLGSATDAEDVLQDTYLRWQGQTEEEIGSARSFLATVVVRLCIDQLRCARVRRASYVGPWLPEPLATEDDDPALVAELADSLSLAFLVLLEKLSPLERAAFILRDVFAYSYDELAPLLGRSEGACRQLASRARRQVGDRRRRVDGDRQRGERLADRFVSACATGDVDDLLGLLAPDVVVWTDGGGKAKAAPRPVVGAWRAARFLINVSQTLSASGTVRYASINGQAGVVVEEDGIPVAAAVLDAIEGVIGGVRILSNPDKLEALSKGWRHGRCPKGENWKAAAGAEADT